MTAAPRSPLFNEHQSLGASFTDFAGWQMPLKYESELAEHRAVRSTAGLFDLSHMGEIDVSGPDAGSLLDYALAGELSKVAVGRAKYSLLCNADGGVIDDLVVYRLGDEHYSVVANASNAPTVVSELISRAAGFTATVTDRSTDTALIAVQGPAAEAIVLGLVPDSQAELVRNLKYYAVVTADVAGQQVLLARTGYTGEDGFELYIQNAGAIQLWHSLLVATAEHGGVPAGLACRDTLRLEAGMALYGHELTLATNPYEAGLGRVVRLNKDFVGRDALRQLSEADPRMRLVGLIGTGRRAAREGYRVFDLDSEHDIGSITSGCLSPTLGHPIALAYIDVASSELATEVEVDIRGKSERFSVTSVPFYRRS